MHPANTDEVTLMPPPAAASTTGRQSPLIVYVSHPALVVLLTVVLPFLPVVISGAHYPLTV